MTRRDLRVAAFTAFAALAFVLAIGAVSLYLRSQQTTTQGPPPNEGALIPISTAAPVGDRAECDAALMVGRLVRHPAWVLAVSNPGREPVRVIWPHGYIARVEEDGMALLDARRHVVAHTGDEIRLGGGLGDDGWFACPAPIEVVP